MDRAEPIRLLIVDDSALIRKLLGDLLKSSPEIEVVGAARDGEEALELAARLKPDVITLDVEMPGMSGLDVLPLLLDRHQVPVVMVSSFTKEGADITLQALELGAVDFLPKPDRQRVAELVASRDLLIAKVLAAARSRVRQVAPGPGRRTSLPRPRAQRDHGAELSPSVESGPLVPCLMIGISTGGPQALGQIVPFLVPPLPPLLVVQHMPARFTGVFSERLDRQCALSVKEAEEGDRLLPNQVLVAPGGRHMTIVGSPRQARVALKDGPLVSGHKPSVDMLFHSGARVYQSDAVGIIMTGMGRDGVEGCKSILGAGGRTFGQDEATSVVYGMNKAAYLEGAVSTQFALEELPALLTRLARVG